MRLEHYSAEKLKVELLSIVGKYLPINDYKVFFFGSRVSGHGDSRSDIDIGIEGPEKISLEIMSKIREEIEKLPFLYKFDIVDMNSTDESFKKVVKKDMELIN